MIIGITGTLAAGKGTIVEYLESKGFKHYSVRNFLIEKINEKNLPVNRDSMVLVANELRKNNSPSYIAEQLYLKAKKHEGNSIIESLRTPGEVNSLKEKEKFYLFSVDADQKLRYKRAFERKSETDHISYETFVENEKREMSSNDPNKQNLSTCIEMADFKFINNGTIEEFHGKLEKVLKEIK